ncbi:MAG: hypothetical protein OSJ72_19680 [Lachnospiraceae bacterium]|nr:hypothetical protein [Lachnospiraceae bacterium]
MNKKILKITTFLISLILILDMFFYCSMTVYAFPARLKDGTWIDKPWSEAVEEIWLTIQYGLSQIGVFFTNGADFKQWLQNTEEYQDLWDENGRLAKNVSIDTETGNVTYNKEIMTVLKSAADDYAKEHEPYYMVNTLTLDDFTGNSYAGSKIMYDTAKNLLEDSPSGVIAFGAYYSTPTQMFFVDIGNDFRNVSAVNPNNTNFVTFYNNETWGQSSYPAYEVQLTKDDAAIKTASEFKEKAKYKYSYGTDYNHPIGYRFRVYISGSVVGPYPYDCRFPSNSLSLVTKEKRRIRVFNTYGDFQNFTLGKRSIYYTEKYYNYVPEDLSVSIDDLQKTVDDLQKVIDELLKQIQDDTDEKQIEELLKQILDALKNQPGGGGGSGGGGGGDVTVDIDLTQTNSWLSKIYQMLKNISDKLAHFRDDFSFFVEDFKNMFPDVGTGESTSWLQEQLDEIIKLLKSIKRWTAVDTVIDGVDALADWLDLIKDVIKDAKEGAGSAVAAIAGTVGDSVDMMSQKFPFSVPWDILFFISVLSAEPQVPHFEIPFNIELSALDVTIDYTMELDFEKLQWLSDLSRLLLSMTYAVGLLKMTAGITSVGKEG